MKAIPFTKDQIEALAGQHSTPFYVYDEAGIRRQARELNAAFSWNKGFKEYFAVKALPNPAIMEILKGEGCGADCSSLAELVLAEKVGITGEDIMFSSNDTPAAEYVKARELGAIINLDDITHIEYLEEHAGIPEVVCFRYNPGTLRSGNAIIGKPEEAKYGFTKEQLFEGFKKVAQKGVKRFGLHTMVVSNQLDPKYFVETADMLFDLVVEISKELGITFEFVNLGGGIGIPYRPEDTAVDINFVSQGIQKSYEERIVKNGLAPLKIYMEHGRVMTGPYGYLVTTVLHKKDIYKKYIGVDASMADLMRPGMYGAYHHITVLGKESAAPTETYDVVGSLCENNDKFAIDRQLPPLEAGDILVIHDAGAHSHAMGFNYNGKLRHAEFLLSPDGAFKMIRRAETLDDYFATLSF